MTLLITPYTMTEEELCLERELEEIGAWMRRRDNGLLSISDDVFDRLSRRGTRQIGETNFNLEGL